MKIWESLMQESHIVLNIGANTGIYSLMSASVNDNIKVYAFEPLERIFNILKKNIELNKKGKIIYPYQYAVSSFSGIKDFYDMESFDNQIASFKKEHVLKHQHAKTLKKIKVKTISIDDFVMQTKIQDIDLIKIDVEGVEDEVLKGMRESVSKFRPIILCEISGDKTAITINDFFKNKNYLLYDIYESGRLEEKKMIEKTNLNYLFVPLEKRYVIDKI